MKEISEAFEIHGNSAHQQTDRFCSYDELHGDLDEDGSDFSYNSETESELEYVDDDMDSLNQKAPMDDGNIVDVFGVDGSLASRKAAFDALAGKAALEPEFEKQVSPFASQGCPDQSNPAIGKKSGGENGLRVAALCVLPLYAMLPAAAQLRVFEEIKEGERLLVVATKMAETSLTIPGIKYVVDENKQFAKTPASLIRHQRSRELPEMEVSSLRG